MSVLKAGFCGTQISHSESHNAVPHTGTGTTWEGYRYLRGNGRTVYIVTVFVHTSASVLRSALGDGGSRNLKMSP